MARGKNKAAAAAEAPASASEPIGPDGEVFHGRTVTRHKIGLYAANDLAFDRELEFGDWVEITIKGRVGGFEIDETKGGVAVKAKVTVKNAEIVAIEEPDDGQVKLWDAKGKIDPEVAAVVESVAESMDPDAQPEGDDFGGLDAAFDGADAEASDPAGEDRIPHRHIELGLHAHGLGDEDHDHDGDPRVPVGYDPTVEEVPAE